MVKITCNSRCFKLTYNKINYDKEKFAEYLHLRMLKQPIILIISTIFYHIFNKSSIDFTTVF